MSRDIITNHNIVSIVEAKIRGSVKAEMTVIFLTIRRKLCLDPTQTNILKHICATKGR